MSTYEVLTKDGMLKVTILDKASPDRVFQYLFKGAWAAKLGNVTDSTPTISKNVKKILVHVGGS